MDNFSHNLYIYIGNYQKGYPELVANDNKHEKAPVLQKLGLAGYSLLLVSQFFGKTKVITLSLISFIHIHPAHGL